jgi:anaerobic sulfite reductase subunit C
MKWSEDAEAAISRVPFFVRRRVRKRVEDEAMRSGARTVEMTHVITCRNAFLRDMSKEVKGYQVETCFGQSGCEHRIAADTELVTKLEALLAAQDLKSFLGERVQGPLKMHHEFRVTVADCPNGCSRPQISDLGIVAVQQPLVSDAACTRCLSCVNACAEDAVILADDEPRPSIDPARCLMCGDCVRACASGTIVPGREGYRLLLGGKLGRHPQLARPLDRVLSATEILPAVEQCLGLYKAHNQRGERFGEILNRVGFTFLDR